MSKLIQLLQDRLKEMQVEVQTAKEALDTAQRRYAEVKSQADAYEVALQAERQNTASSTPPRGDGVFRKQLEGKPVAETPISAPKPLLGGRSEVRQEIVRVFWTEKRSLRANIVQEKLKSNGFKFSRKSVWRGLARLENLGVLRRLGYGLYELKNGDARTSAPQ